MPYLEYLTDEEYKSRTKELEGGHWTPNTIAGRWDYHRRTIGLIKALNIKDPSKILEMGTMGVSCVKNAQTIDYAERWNFPGKKPNYLHDARKTPWPIEDKAFELFIALRVYMHLTPRQEKCVMEAIRIAKKIIIVTSETYQNSRLPNSKGITYSDFVNYLDGIHPNLYTPTRQGSLFYWDTEKPSYLNIEEVMKNQKTDKKQNTHLKSLASRIKRKLAL
jgi:hypothetical protein